MDGDIETTDNVDYFYFDGEADRQYVIETILGTNGDTEIKLHGPDGSLIDSNDNSDQGEDYASRIEWSAPGSGRYLVAVSGHDGATGTYQLTVTESR